MRRRPQQAHPSAPTGTLAHIQCAGDSLYVQPSFLIAAQKWHMGALVIFPGLVCSCSIGTSLLVGSQ